MLARARVYLPAVARLSAIRVWTGFRAATPDKLPLIGPDPGDPTLWLATGHEGLGITTSLATAELIADLITNRRSRDRASTLSAITLCAIDGNRPTLRERGKT